MSEEADPRERRAAASGGDARRQVLDDARILASDLQEALDRTSHELRRHLETHPYWTLGAVAAAGYVLAGGLASRVTTFALGASGRVAMSVLAREVASGFASKEGR